jgi:GDP-L-fucose synthase
MLDKVLITGGHGFVGTSLRKLYPEAIVPRSAEFDLVEKGACELMFCKYSPDVVIHLAARVGGIGANRANPGKFAYDNLMMGANVVECARKYKTRKVVAAGTICSYPKFTPVPFKESDLWGGYPEDTNAPYALAKKMVMVLGQAYRKQYGTNVVTLLVVNLYGPGDHFDLENSHVIPAMIRKFHEAKAREEPMVTLWGDGSPTREFLYVDDAAEAIHLAEQAYDDEEPMNVGSGSEISMAALAEKIRYLVGYQGKIVWDTSKPNGQPRRCLDVSKAAKRIGWISRTSMEEGLARTYEWCLREQPWARG